MKTGVYLDAGRHTAAVVKVSKTSVWFLSFHKGYVDLSTCSIERFLHDWPIRLEGYPVTRAVQIFWESEFKATPESYKIMQVIVGDAAQQRHALTVSREHAEALAKKAHKAAEEAGDA